MSSSKAVGVQIFKNNNIPILIVMLYFWKIQYLSKFLAEILNDLAHGIPRWCCIIILRWRCCRWCCWRSCTPWCRLCGRRFITDPWWMGITSISWPICAIIVAWSRNLIQVWHFNEGMFIFEGKQGFFFLLQPKETWLTIREIVSYTFWIF